MRNSTDAKLYHFMSTGGTMLSLVLKFVLRSQIDRSTNPPIALVSPYVTLHSSQEYASLIQATAHINLTLRLHSQRRDCEIEELPDCWPSHSHR